MKSFLLAFIVFSLFILNTLCIADDWPMWRYDTNRSAASPQELPEELHLQWVREYPASVQAWENPLNRDLMQFDRVNEPIVMGKTMFMGSSANDRFVAINTDTGEEKWSYCASGPVRFPAVAHNNRVYFVSDDGHLYCLNAQNGELVWKFQGGPSDRKILGNERLVSTWPARGGPVLKDGVIYFAAGIWPFMGIFIYALDAETGDIVWENDSTGPIYMKQPHNSPSYAGVAPQGTFVISGDKLLIPCGRSVPACFDVNTGELLYYHLSRYNKTGGAFVCASDKYFINYHRDYVTSIYDIATGDIVISRFGKVPVMTNDMLYSIGDEVKAYDLESIKTEEKNKRLVVDKKEGKAKTVLEKRTVIDELWSCNVDATGDLIKSGKMLYAGGRGIVSAIEIPAGKGKPEVKWQVKIDGTASRLIAADNKLFVVTLEGYIYTFGADKTESKFYAYKPEKIDISQEAMSKAKSILETTGIKDGYCLLYGLGDGNIAEALVSESDLRVIAVDSDPERVKKLRNRYIQSGLYGKRLSVFVGDPATFPTPEYMASLTVFGDKVREQDDEFFKKIYKSVRPYGGIVYISVDGSSSAKLEKQLKSMKLAQLVIEKSTASEPYMLIKREGPLPGSADWTHQYGDIANTVKSDDKLVKLPLGLLWFGGSSNTDVLPRHGHGPPEQIIGGRLFIEGIDVFSARDVYTGRVLWKREITDMDIYNVYYDETYADTPLSPAYNQVHIPGANARGTNFVATKDKLYIAKSKSCLVLDPATGKTIDEFWLPKDPDTGEDPDWGYIGIYRDYLIAGADFVSFLDLVEPDEIGAPNLKGRNHPFYDFDITSSKYLVVMDRHTGDVKWTHKSDLGFRHNGVIAGDGKIFCLDTLPIPIKEALQRRPSRYRFDPDKILALDVKSGDVVWSTNKDIFGTWLSYSEEHDILLQSGRKSRDMMRGEPEKGIIAYRGKTGDVLWSNTASEGGPYMLHGDTIITDRHAYSLLDGKQIMRVDPLTGEEEPWIFQRNYGCNYAIASEYLLTFRSAAAGFYDLMRDGGTGNFGGFKSSCTSNLIVANGLLNAPDYTRTCSCSYQNQSSLAMIHMPDIEIWTDYFEENRPSDVQLTNEPLALVSTSGSVTYANKALLKMWEFEDSEEILGKTVPEVWQMGRESVSLIQGLQSSGEWSGKVVMGRKDGPSIETYLSAKVIMGQNGDPENIMLMFAKADESDKLDKIMTKLDSAINEGEGIQTLLGGRELIKSVGINLGAPGDRRADDGILWLEYPISGGPSPTVAVAIEPEDYQTFYHHSAKVVPDKNNQKAYPWVASSGIMGASSISIKLAEADFVQERPYTVRLYFAEFEDIKTGQRKFSVLLQDEKVLDGFDIVKETKGVIGQPVIKEFKGVMVDGDLRINLKNSNGSKPPVLSGMEIVAEGW
ncbi:PQQ-binding-like beta-propeller repeat protein [Candidatus Poribacteria bacterium]|nr:PQQ-binding-like beta-propeller repeat protein [Candidatus Poribacteria bacterium]